VNHCLFDSSGRAILAGYPMVSTADSLIPMNSSVSPLEMLDRRLLTILDDVRLTYLLDREGGWDASANWEDMLSLGEQQRLGMVSSDIENV
jgi:ABC-type uncharacterized transport system fused permease/ATPase subunit